MLEPELYQSELSPYREFSESEFEGHPPPCSIENLVPLLFEELRHINNPVMKAFYFHHEILRIKPFSNSNDLIARMGKNWILMFYLFPPIFIHDINDYESYLRSKYLSFIHLTKNQNRLAFATQHFFDLEWRRLEFSVGKLTRSIHDLVENPVSKAVGLSQVL
ncbi:Fic family protein [Reichenbachiella versicolor]|uniref:Fic family protein n=1 Tax=Reichenbachiella versicolor TaxID=1821036 RepID=UPI000D6E57F4|nr:Fic family protein [Reichenbachiella versicolor]